MSSFIAKLQKRLAKEESGFTLIELLIVLVIIGILLAIAVPSYLGFKDRAYKSAAQANVRSAVPAVEAYYADNGNYTNMACDDRRRTRHDRARGHRRRRQDHGRRYRRRRRATASATRRAASPTTSTAPQATSRPRPARAADPPRTTRTTRGGAEQSAPPRRCSAEPRPPLPLTAYPLKVVTPPTDSRPMQVSRSSTIAAPSAAATVTRSTRHRFLARPAAWVTAHPLRRARDDRSRKLRRAPRSCLRLRDAPLLPGRVRLRGARPLDRPRAADDPGRLGELPGARRPAAHAAWPGCRTTPRSPTGSRRAFTRSRSPWRRFRSTSSVAVSPCRSATRFSPRRPRLLFPRSSSAPTSPPMPSA